MTKNNHAVSQSDHPKMQMHFMDFIQNYANRYVGGMSSSLPMEEMQSLAASALYQITFCLKEDGISDPAWSTMHAETLFYLQKRGIQKLNQKVKESQEHFHRIQRERIKIPQRAYQDTLMKGIPLFFSEYNLAYAAHEIPGSIDYQLSTPIVERGGILFIADYLRQLDLENQFCRKYSPVMIHQLMKAFDKQYESHLENHFEHVFLQALGKILLNQNPAALTLTAQDIERLDNLLLPMSACLLKQTLRAASQDLVRRFSADNEACFQLADQLILQALARIQNALAHQAIDKIWTILL